MNLYDFLDKCDDEKIKAFPIHVMQISKESNDSMVTIKIPLPKNVVENLPEIKNWVMYALAIPKQEYNKIFENEEG